MESTEIRSKDIRLVPITEVKPNPKNRNKHSPEQITRLVEIIRYQGFRSPLIISNQTGLLVAGHGRLMAAKELGLKDVPVTFQDFDSEEQEYAAGVSENSIASWAELDFSGINADLGDLGPDFDIDLLGIKNFEIEVADKEGLTDEDAIPEHVEPKTKLGDVYQLGNHRLLCGNSTSADDFAKLMDGETAELCFTSPPYADQREYNGGKELSTEHLATFIRTALGACQYFAVNLGYSRKDGEVYPYWDDYIAEAKNCGLKLLSWNIWDRSGLGVSIGNQTAFFPIWHEWIFIFGEKAKDLHRTKENKSAGSKSGTNRQSDGTTRKGSGVTAEFGKMGTVTKCGVADGKLHPAMFPVEFPEQYIEAMTSAGDAVYEPFGGSGTTMIAAEKLSRRAFLMELDPKYCSVIIERWCAFTGQMAYLINDDGTQTSWEEIKQQRSS